MAIDAQSSTAGQTVLTPIPDAYWLFKNTPYEGAAVSDDFTYLAAVGDASAQSPGESVSWLTVIDASNALLEWEGTPGESRALMVLFTDYHSAYVGHEGEDVLVSVELWLTASPDMKTYFSLSGDSGEDPTGRLIELLGLPPDSDNDLIVELWVDPEDLFRPSADPDITNPTGGFGAPSDSYTLSTGQNYADWYESRLSWIYDNTGGDSYPWTGLGYTYDWGNPFIDYGLSEFVLNKNSTVGVKATYTVEEYLGLEDAASSLSASLAPSNAGASAAFLAAA